MKMPFDVNVYLSEEEYEATRSEKSNGVRTLPSRILVPSISFFNSPDEVEDVRKHMAGGLESCMAQAFPELKDDDYASRRFIYAIPSDAERKWRAHRFFDNTLSAYVDVDASRLRVTFAITSFDCVQVRDRYFMTEEYLARMKEKETEHALPEDAENKHIAAWKEYLNSTVPIRDARTEQMTLPEIWIPYRVDITNANVQRPRRSIISQIFS